MIAAATSDPAPMGMSSTAGEFANPEIASNTSATSSDAGTAVAAAAANEGALAPASGMGASMAGVAERHAAMAVVDDRRTRAPAGCTKAAAAKLRSIATKAKTRAICNPTSLLQIETKSETSNNLCTSQPCLGTGKRQHSMGICARSVIHTRPARSHLLRRDRSWPTLCYPRYTARSYVWRGS